MADGEVLALLDHIKDIGERTEKKLDQHIERDESTNKDFLLPLWEAHQRRIGARALVIALCSAVSAGAALAVDWIKK